MRKKHQIRLLAVISTILILGLLTFVIQNIRTTGTRPLTFLLARDPKIYDPQSTSNPDAYEVFRHVCEPLLFIDESGRLVGRLANNIEFKNNGLEIVIQLRDDILFHDGTLVTAASVVESFTRLKQLGRSPLTEDFRDVSIIERDGLAIFILPQVDYEFANLLAHPYSSIVRTSEENEGFPICTGAFQFVPAQYKEDESINLIRFEAYAWAPPRFNNRGKSHIPMIRFDFVVDSEERFERLLANQTCVLSLNLADLVKATNEETLRLYKGNGGVTYLGFNFSHPRWQDQEIRKAIASSINKERLANSGPFYIAKTPLTPSMNGYDETVGNFAIEYNPGESQKTLSNNSLDITKEVLLIIPVSNTYRGLAELVVQDLESIGLNVRVQEIPKDELLEERIDFDLILFDYAWADYTALSNFLGPTTRNLLNYFDNDIYDLVWQARRIEDFDTRHDAIIEIQKQILENTIYEPLIIRELTIAVNGNCVDGEVFLRNTSSLEYYDAFTHGK